MYIKWKLAQQSRSPSWGTIKSRTTINRGFSPAGTEEWALLKTPEEHMLRHSLLRPQMFLNSWFPQVAFPFSPRYCANYFSARSTWVACCSDCASSAPFFFFFSPLTPEAPNTRTAEYQAQLCDTLVPQHYWLFWNAYESWWSIFLALRFRSQIRFVQSKFPAGLLSQWCYSGKFIYIKKSNHCLYCLFRMICVLLYVLHLLPCWKAQKNTNRVLPLFTKCTVMPLVIAVDNSIHWHGGRRAAQSPKKKKKSVSSYCLSRRIFQPYIFHISHKHGVEPLPSATTCDSACAPVYQCYSQNLICYSFSAGSNYCGLTRLQKSPDFS